MHSLSNTAVAADTDNDRRAADFIKLHEEEVRPLEISTAVAWWDANTSGKDTDFAAKVDAQNKLDAALSDPRRFAELKAVHDAPLSNRQAPDRHSLPDVFGEAGRSGPARSHYDHGQRNRKVVQRLSRQGGRQATGR